MYIFDLIARANLEYIHIYIHIYIYIYIYVYSFGSYMYIVYV
jgi:hypothetical protein